MSTEHTLSEALETAQARIAELEAALRWYAEQTAGCKLIHSEGDKYRNALSNDGGERARAALSLTPPVAVWPRVVQVRYGKVIYGTIIVFANANERGYAYSGDEMFYRTQRTSVESWLDDFPRDTELHGPERIAALAKCGLDENGKAIKKDG